MSSWQELNMICCAEDPGYVTSGEMLAGLATLKRLADSTKKEEDLHPSTVKSIPKSLNPELTTFACLMMRESAPHTAARNRIFDQVDFSQLCHRSLPLGRHLKSAEEVLIIMSQNFLVSKWPCLHISEGNNTFSCTDGRYTIYHM